LEGGSEDSPPSKVDFEEALIHNKQLTEELHHVKTQMNECQEKNTVLGNELRLKKKGDTEPLVCQVQELKAALEDKNGCMSTLQTQVNRMCDTHIAFFYHFIWSLSHMNAHACMRVNAHTHTHTPHVL
jgi:hypothetical protein